MRVLGQPQLGPRRCHIPNGEHPEVDAGRHDPNLAGIRVIQVDQLTGLAPGVCHEAVSGVHDLSLTDLATRRLWRVPFRQPGVLDARHRVHRVHQRHPPTVSRQPAHLPGEPVVGVHEVIPALGSGRLRAHDPLGERAQLTREVSLAQALEWPCDDVAYVDPGRYLGLERQTAVGHPGEDLNLYATHRQPFGDLDDVHVQTTRIACSWLLERRGVDAEHGNPTTLRHCRHRSLLAPGQLAVYLLVTRYLSV